MLPRQPFALTAARYSIYAPVASFSVYCLTSAVGYWMEVNYSQLVHLAYTAFYGSGLVNLSGFAMGLIGLAGGIRRRARGIRLRSMFGLVLNGVVLFVWGYLTLFA